MKYPGGVTKAVTLSYDDGVEQDKRLIEILNKHGLKCTFNLNSGLYSPEGTVFPKEQFHRRMSESEVTAVYKDSGHEVAAHGYTHPALISLPANVATQEVCKDVERLEKQFGTFVRGFAYPFGGYDDTSMEILKNCGICYARTVESTHDFHIPKNWLKLPATCHHGDPELMKLCDSFLDDRTMWTARLFYLWGHSYEFEIFNNWDVIEKFAVKMGGRDDVWYATNIEVYDYVKAYKSLIFNTDFSKVYNPSAMPIWFAADKKDYKIEGGATIELI